MSVDALAVVCATMIILLACLIRVFSLQETFVWRAAQNWKDLCTGLAGADLVAPPPEDTVVLDLRPRIGIVREEIPWLRQKEACTGRAAGRSLPWRSFQLQMRPRSVVVPEGLAIIV